MRNSDKDAALQAVYDQIPPMASCEGYCWNSCGPIPMSDRERQRIREAGYRITLEDMARKHDGTFWCDALTSEGKCAVYEIRPAICHLWGTARALRCPWGCVPEGGWVDDVEGMALLAEAMEAGGGNWAPGTADRIRAEGQDPQARAKTVAFARAGGDISRFPSRTSTELPPEITSRKPRRLKASKERMKDGGT